MSTLSGSAEGTAVTGLDSSPVDASPGTLAALPPLTARTETEAREIIARYPEPRSALLPMLHLVQSVQGYVSPEGIAFCARQLGLSQAEVAGVSTFYTMYKRHPTGRHLVSVCTNTLCAVLGGQQVYDAVAADLGIGHDQTTPDGAVTLEHAECLAACDYAPVVTIDYEFYDQQDIESARALVAALRRGERPAPTRGAALTDFRGVSRQLAGFSQHADAAAERAAIDGPSAGEPTLIGVRLAAERGESAPPMGDAHPESGPEPTVQPARNSGRTAEAQAADTAVASADTPAEEAGAAQHHPDAPEPAGRAPAGRGRAGTKTPPTRTPGASGQGTSVEREV